MEEAQRIGGGDASGIDASAEEQKQLKEQKQPKQKQQPNSLMTPNKRPSKAAESQKQMRISKLRRKGKKVMRTKSLPLLR